MPGRLSRPVREKIAKLHEDGLQQKEIAERLGLARGTVSTYVREADEAAELALSPAARLTDDEVSKLEFLAGMVDAFACPGCGEAVYALATTMRGTCDACGTGWRRVRGEGG